MKLLVLFLFLIPSLIHSADDDKTVIRVNNRTVTMREFMNRLNGLPRLSNESADSLKENLICTLIAESILANSASEMKLDTARRYRLMSQEYEKEALYEQWMKSEIRSKVRFSEQELRNMYEKMRNKLELNYWTFDTKQKAKNFINSVKKDSSLLANPMAKTIQCGEALPEVENAVYNLKKGEMTAPLQVDNLYYVFMLKGKTPHPVYSKQNYIYWMDNTQEMVVRRKEKDILDTAFFKILAGKDFTINHEGYDYILSKLYPIIYGSNNNLRFPKSEFIQLDLINNENNEIKNIENVAVVSFRNGETWTVKDMWEKIAVSPYPLNYKNPADLKPGLLDVIRRIIILEAISGDAKSKGYDNSEAVQEDEQMWNSNNSAYAFIGGYLSSLTISDADLQTMYDSTKYDYIRQETRRIEYISLSVEEEARKVYSLASSGADFENLFREYVDSSKQNTDEISTYITIDMLGDIGKAAFQMKKVNDISEPLKINDTLYAVVKLLEIRRAAPYAFDEVKDKLIIKKRVKELSDYLDDYMKRNSSKYNVYINRALIAQIPFIEGETNVTKTHFPLRSLAPSFLGWNRNAEWYKDLLKRIEQKK